MNNKASAVTSKKYQLSKDKELTTYGKHPHTHTHIYY